MISPERLAEIQARSARATPGPWWHAAEERGWCSIHSRADTVTAVYLTTEDADFVAAAREDVPALVAEVRRLRAELLLAAGSLAWACGYMRGLDETPKTPALLLDAEERACKALGFGSNARAILGPGVSS